MMTIRTFYFVAMMIALAGFSASSVNAQQDAVQLDVDSGLTIIYKPFSGQASSEPYQIKLIPSLITDVNPDLDLTNTQIDTYILRIRPSDQGTFNLLGESQQLPIMLQADNASQFELVNNEYTQLIKVDGQSTETQIFDYQISIPESIYAEPGIFELELDVELLDVATGDTIGSVKTVLIEARVDAKLQTNIAGSRGRYEDGEKFAVIDFGVLETAETGQVFIQVRGNAPAKITVSSENKGKMVHTKRPTFFVDYSVSVDGVDSSLDSPLNLSRSVARDLQGSAYPMIVTIGDVEGSFAGTYKDIIQVDVSPE